MMMIKKKSPTYIIITYTYDTVVSNIWYIYICNTGNEMIVIIDIV